MDTAIAVTGAYLLVAFADGQYAPSEERRFLTAVANDPALGLVKTEALEIAYNLLIDEIKADYGSAANRILPRIAEAKSDAAATAAVKLAARCAVVADRKLMPQEELALSRIAAALGLKEGEL